MGSLLILALKSCLFADVPKVAFSASLGGNGLVQTKGYQRLVYKDVITNIGEAYNTETGTGAQA